MTPEQRKEIRERTQRKLHPPLPFLDKHFMADEVLTILRQGSPLGEFGSPMILAIKHVRKVTGWLLMESKQYVEAVRDGKPLPDTKSFRDF